MKLIKLFLALLLALSFVACEKKSDSISSESNSFKVSLAPALGNLAINSSFIIEFSEAYDESTVNSTNIYILDSNNTKLTSTVTTEYLNLNAKVKPSSLSADSNYTIVVTVNVKNDKGIPLKEEYKWKFKTSASTDDTSPSIKTILPLDSATVDIKTNIIIEFDELLDTTRIPSNALSLKDSNNNTVRGIFGYLQQWIWFFPTSELKTNETYTLSLSANVYDLSGNQLTMDVNNTFTSSDTALDSRGFGKVASDFSLRSTSYSILSIDDNTKIVGSDGKIFKLFTPTNTTPSIASTFTHDSLGKVYDLKNLTAQKQASCNANNYIAYASDKGFGLFDYTTDTSVYFKSLPSPSYGIDISCNTTNNHVELYVANSSAGVKIYDINDINNVTLTKEFATAGLAFDIEEYNAKIYLASYANGVQQYSKDGVLLHTISTATTSRLRLFDNQLIASNGIAGIASYDISSSTPSEIAKKQSLTTVVDAYANNDNIFALTSSKGVGIFSNDSNMSNTNQIPSINKLVSITGDSEFIYTLSLSGAISIYAQESTQRKLDASITFNGNTTLLNGASFRVATINPDYSPIEKLTSIDTSSSILNYDFSTTYVVQDINQSIFIGLGSIPHTGADISLELYKEDNPTADINISQTFTLLSLTIPVNDIANVNEILILSSSGDFVGRVGLESSSTHTSYTYTIPMIDGNYTLRTSYTDGNELFYNSGTSTWEANSTLVEVSTNTVTSEVPKNGVVSSTPSISSQDFNVVSAGFGHTAGIKYDGTLWAWGYNASGQLGDYTTTAKLVPTQIEIGTTWQSVTTGNNHTAAIQNDGSLWTWGSNLSGQLGDGNTSTNRDFPFQIDANNSWTSVSAGDGYTTAIKNGTLWTWGANFFGQLGDSTNVEKSVPTQIGSDTNWTSVSAGTAHTTAIQNGTLWTWGANASGQLGNGSAGGSIATPTQVGTDTNWTIVSAGAGHTTAIQNGTLWTWGDNTYGQLGDGNTTNLLSPTQVGIDTDWISVSAGYKHTIAIKNNGTLWAWGNNDSGQLGDGTTVGKLVPTQIGVDTNWATVTAGANHVVSIKDYGTLWTWGDNTYGQLGDGSQVDLIKPKLIYGAVFLDLINQQAALGSIVSVKLYDVYNGTDYILSYDINNANYILDYIDDIYDYHYYGISFGLSDGSEWWYNFSTGSLYTYPDYRFFDTTNNNIVIDINSSNW